MRPEPRTPFLGARQKLVCWLLVGGSSDDPSRRSVGWNLKEDGWQKLVDRHILPQVDFGFRRFVVSNAFGLAPGEPMRFDAFADAQDAGMDWLTHGFVRAWKPLAQSSLELAAYVGTPENDPDFAKPSWQARFWRCMNPILEAGFRTVMVDGLTGTPADSVSAKVVALLEDAGVRVVGEPRWYNSQPQWWRLPVVSAESFWKRSDPAAFPDSAEWAAPTAKGKGEIIRWIDGPPPDSSWDDAPKWLPGEVRKIWKDGHTAAVGLFDNPSAFFGASSLGEMR